MLAVVLLATALKLVGLGTGALALTMALVLAAGLPLWAFLDGRAQPERTWQAAGYRRRRVLALVSAGAPVGVGLVAAGFYFGRLRPRLIRIAATDEAPGPRPEPAASSASDRAA